jgi:exosome complex exonuclease RRP6
VDLEYYQLARMTTILSLIQLSTVHKDYVIDALVMRSPKGYSKLRKVFEDPKIIKILHGGDTDL